MKYFRPLIGLSSAIILITALSRPTMAATIPPEIKKVVTFIFLADAQGHLLRDAQTKEPIPNGTGFFITVKGDQDPKVLYGYLVTAKHILSNPQGGYYQRVYIRINKKEGDAEFIPLDLMQEGRSVVFINSDPTVDIAVVPALPNADVFDFRTIPDDLLTTKGSFAELHIGEGSDVFFVGLFVDYYGEHRNNPIARFGHVAMFPEDRIPWRDDASKPSELVQLYLLETQSYGGNSGSPVFFFLGSDRVPGSLVVGPPVIKLAGIMKGYFGQSSPLKFVQTPTAAIPLSTQNVGIAAVTPSYLLHDILFSDELKKFRADHPGR
jgi:hypothetical protein